MSGTGPQLLADERVQAEPPAGARGAWQEFAN